MNIIPSYRCNLSCPFCITHKFNPNLLLDLDWFENELNNIDNLSHLNIIGGEPTLLDEKYLDNLIEICRHKLNDKPDLYTNLSIISPLFNKTKLHISLNPWIINQYKIFLKNIFLISQDFKINIVLTNKFIESDYINIINNLLKLKNLIEISLSFYAYFDNFNLEDYTPEVDKYIEFIYNISKIKDSRVHLFSLYSLMHNESKDLSPENCIEILPNNKYRISIRDFIRTDIDVFREYDTWKEAADITKIAIDKYLNFNNCKQCKYCNSCQRLYNEESNLKIMRKIDEYISEL